MSFPPNDQAPHLTRGPGGVAGAVSRLRRDIAATFAALLATQNQVDTGTDDATFLSPLKFTAAKRTNPTYIESPAAPYNADRTALQIYTAKEGISLWAPTATRKIDVRTVTKSMAFTIAKVNAAAFGIAIDVTSGGNQGWTTPAGLNIDYTLVNSAVAATGSWLVIIDLPNKIVYVTPS